MMRDRLTVDRPETTECALLLTDGTPHLRKANFSGGSQGFKAVNSLRLLGRWMRMITIRNQSCVAMAYREFDDERMEELAADIGLAKP
ncbi:MAG: hypothetical protein ABW026_19735 [Microvirga sp.]